MSYRTALRLGLGLLPLLATGAFAQGFNSGSTGADGAWVVPGGQGTISFVATRSTYNFTTVSIGAGTTVQIRGSVTPITVAPLRLLATGDVQIEGTLDLDGEPGHPEGIKPIPARPGLGGWPGGMGAETSSDTPQAGGGPGGGRPGASSLSPGRATHLDQRVPNARTYGNRFLLPLLGGSGGGGADTTSSSAGAAGGGGGGGALLIASSGTINVSGSITARGGAGGTGGSSRWATGGSGGAIRLAANVVSGTGSLDVGGGQQGNGSTSSTTFGSPGRIRLEAPVCTLGDARPPGSLFRSVRPGPLAVPTSAPRLRIVKIDYTDATTGQPATIDPVATNNGSSSSVDAAINATGTVTFHFEGTGIPLDSIGRRRVRIHLKPDSGGDGGATGAPGTEVFLTAHPTTPGLIIGSVELQLAGSSPTVFPNGFSRVFFTASW